MTTVMAPFGEAKLNTAWCKEIRRLVVQQEAMIFAYNYLRPETTDRTDASLVLSRIAMDSDARAIMLCDAHCVAQTARTFAPDKALLIDHSLVDSLLTASITGADLYGCKAERCGAAVLSYVNTMEKVKAGTGICCASSNAVDVVDAILDHRKLRFCPDRLHHVHVRRETGHKDVHNWARVCHVHAVINGLGLAGRAATNPTAELVVRSEYGCATSALYLISEGIMPADQITILSTGGMVCQAATSTWSRLVVAEYGILHRLRSSTLHVKFRAPGAITRALKAVRRHNDGHFACEVELDGVERLNEALALRAEVLLLLEDVALIDAVRCAWATSGATLPKYFDSPTLQTIGTYPETSLTYSAVEAPALELGLNLVDPDTNTAAGQDLSWVVGSGSFTAQGVAP